MLNITVPNININYIFRKQIETLIQIYGEEEQRMGYCPGYFAGFGRRGCGAGTGDPHRAAFAAFGGQGGEDPPHQGKEF